MNTTTRDAIKAGVVFHGQGRSCKACDVPPVVTVVITAKPRKTSWRSFEKLGRLACERYVEPLRIPATGGKFVGKGQFIRQKTACDFAGTIRANGRAFVCDFKVCGDPVRFSLHTDFLKQHQREELIVHGKVGAVSGLLIEATALGCVFFASWKMLVTDAASIPFSEMRMIGHSGKLFDVGFVAG